MIAYFVRKQCEKSTPSHISPPLPVEERVHHASPVTAGWWCCFMAVSSMS
jgi:hypothetical protein